MKALILAGGRGTRLWPLSRRAKPKQFQKLISNKTMLQETVERLLPDFSLKDIFISTNKQYAAEVKKELPAIPVKNIIIEPVSRERVAAFALFMAHLKRDDFKEPILTLPSDHLIKDKKAFLKAVSVGEEFVKKNPKYIITFGAKPDFPDTGLGYIEKGRPLEEINNTKIYKVAFFKEKPNLKRARAYLKSKNYFWNMGIFLFTSALMEKPIKEFVPDTYKRYKKIKAVRGRANFKKIVEKEYPEMDSISPDYSIMENYQNIALIPVDAGWSDIGSWTVLKNCLSSPDKSFIKGNYIGVDSKNVMVYGPVNKLVASVGVKDLVIAVTDDIILICHKDGSQNIRKIIKKIEKNKDFNYL